MTTQCSAFLAHYDTLKTALHLTIITHNLTSILLKFLRTKISTKYEGDNAIVIASKISTREQPV